jgi:hypothetical protein
MTSSRISYHVHITFTPDRKRLKQHIGAIQPHFLLISGEQVDLAKELQQVTPSTNFIWRHGSDALVYQKLSPEAWLNERSSAAPGMFLYTSDETPLDNQAIDWHLKVMELAAERGVKLCVMNFAAGTPNPEQWSQARPIIDMLNAHRDLFVMGLREYAGGVVTSGVDGGNPTMIKPDTWPKDVANVDLWHMGRYRNLQAYCQSENIQTPRLVVTHHGFEFMPDIAEWLNSLMINPDHGEIRGWRSLDWQWMDESWFNGIYDNAEEAYLEQIKWANNVLYEPFGAVEAQMLYSWGFAGDAERTLDISQAFDFQKGLEKWAATQPDYSGYTGATGNEALQAMSDADKAQVVQGFQKAIEAGFLDGTTTAALQRWIGIVQQS